MTEEVQPVEEVEEVATQETEEVAEETTETEETEETPEEDQPAEEVAEQRADNKKNAARRTAYKQSLKYENERLKRQLEEAYATKQPVQPQPREQPRDLTQKPMLSDYEDADKWADDRDEWSQRQATVVRDQAKTSTGYNEKLEAYALENPTFEEDMMSSPYLASMNAFVSDAVRKSPEGARITHILANDDKLAQELNRMPAADAMRKVIELEGKPQKKIVTSNAPKPPNSSNGEIVSKGKDLAALEGQAYRDYMNKGIF